jgi:acyl transferase domain-containing protein/ubiquinone/menaquinone biosynthesis C-methylase UbiE/aryl carrier-like protein
VSNTQSDDTLTGLEVAVIGMAGRFPGATDIDSYWRNLCEGRECLTRFSDAELIAAGVPAARLADPAYVKVAGVLDGMEDFDAAFFGYSPREAASIDPQQRVFLETAWTALEHAGYDASRSGAGIGVYAGVGRNSYLNENVLADTEDAAERLWHPAVIGNDKDFLATRVSYKLNLEGPSVVVQTACSTSLVAIHVAVQALLGGECDMALAGGATIRLPQVAGYHYQQDGILSPDGHCRAFDADANGCVPGNGVGVVVLKRLADALQDGDTVHAVVKGSAINNDGAGKAGYTAPRIDGQAAVIRAAQQVADVEPRSIGYVEAHGTGTVIGDPIELAALSQAFADDGAQRQYCAIGAVKTNIGHLDTAAGVAGFIKAVLAVRHGVLPPSLNFKAPNPKFDFSASPFFVNDRLGDWPAHGDGPRRAAVSAFGIGGTNAHVILEQAPPVAASSTRHAYTVLVNSARSAAAADAGSAALARHLREPAYATLALADLAYTSQLGRRAFKHRRALVCADRAQALQALDGAGSMVSGIAPREAPRVVHVFPGQGSQHLGMGRGLYASEPVFRDCIDGCARWLRAHADIDLGALLFDTDDESALRDTRLAQPALFALEYALAELLSASGLGADAMLGHSLGEYVAACRAGVFSLEDGLRLVAARGRLMSSVPAGAMLAVPMARDELEALLGTELDIAAINTDALCVVSGPGAAIGALQATLAARDIEARMLITSHAFHSRMLDPILPAFAACFDDIRLAPPQRPYVSNLTGTWITAEQATSRQYWVDHLRRPVAFAAGVRTLLATTASVFLEVGPGQAMSALARRNGAPATTVIPLMPAADQGAHGDEARVFATALARAWVNGAPLDWASRHGGERRRRVPMPTYPFERQRHWLEPARKRDARADRQRKLANLADWFQLPSWQRAAPLGGPRGDATATPRHWLIFADNLGLGARLGGLLREHGHQVSTVVAEQELNQVVAGFYTLRAGHAADMDGLMHLLRAHQGLPTGVVHCWGVNPCAMSQAGVAQGLDQNFYSLLDLVQALDRAGADALARLVVVGSGVHDVTGGEPRSPLAAAALGAVRVLPREWPQLECMHVDVAADGADIDTLAVQLLAEIEQGDGVGVVALRRGQRWRECFEPVALAAGNAPAPYLRERGTYLITGGLGGVGLVTAEYLAETLRARLVLCSRSGFPPRAEWDALSSNATSAPLPVLGDFLGERQREVLAAQPLTELAAVPGLADALLALCAAHAWQILEAVHGRALGAETIARQTWRDAIAAPYRRQFDMLLACLAHRGLLHATSGDGLRFSATPPPAAATLHEALCAAHPQLAPLFDLLAHCAAHTPPVLRGDGSGLEVLFGENALALFRAGSAVILEHSSMRIQHQLLRALVQQWLQARGVDARRTPLRILEVGGGEGHLAWTLAPVLAGENVEYHYTDIAPSFVASAAREARRRDIDFMRFATLDIEQDLPAQGYGDDGVDLVLAFNVVHATRDVTAALTRLARALKPGGALILIESLRSTPWVDLVWGLTEGWWHYEDEALRGASPLLEAATWQTVMQAAGLTDIETWPRDSLAVDAALLVARKPLPAVQLSADTDTARAIAKLRRIEALGSEVMIARCDITDAAAVQRLLGDIEHGFGALDGVFHSALVLNDSAAVLKTREQAAAVLAPKVQGSLTLAAALRGRPLDCFVAFSSLAAVIGVAGQFDYSAASNVLDAWIEAEAASASPLAKVMMSIDWGVWRDTGMAARLAGQRGERQLAALREGMSSDEGMDALARALGRALPRIAISSQDLAAMMAPPASPTAAADGTDSAVSSAATSQDGAHTAPRNAGERLIAELWQALLGVPRIGADDNFFELGGDSVIGLQFIARARRAGLEVNNKDLFQHQTVAALAAACAAPACADEVAPGAARDAAPTQDDAGVARLRARLVSDGALLDDIYPLAPMQQGMLFHTLDAPASGVYCSRLAYALNGALDVAAFAQAWQDMLARHPILRTSFHYEDLDEPLQAVHREVNFAIEQHDWRRCDAAERERRLDALLDAEGRRGFALDAAPLLRVILVQWDVERWQFVLVHHHLLMDGWCRAQLFDELFACYRARRDGHAATLAPAPAYRLFIDWLRAQDLDASQTYWRRLLEDFREPTPVLGDLPAAAPGAVLEHRFELDADASAALVAGLRRRRLTLSTLVSGAWALWLAGQAQRQDVVFGATIAGRPASLPEAERIIGLFINTLAVRARIAAEQPCAAWLAALQVAQAESRQYEQTPLARVQDWAATPRSLRLFESLVVIENSAGFHGGPERHGDIEIAATRPVIRNSYPLTLRGVPGERLELQLLYDSARFSGEAVAGIAAQVVHAMQALIADDNLTVGALLQQLHELRRQREEARLLAFKDASRQRLQSIRRRPA